MLFFIFHNNESPYLFSHKAYFVLFLESILLRKMVKSEYKSIQLMRGISEFSLEIYNFFDKHKDSLNINISISVVCTNASFTLKYNSSLMLLRFIYLFLAVIFI